MSPRPSPSPLPISIVGGFLGAGKTTLLNNFLVRSQPLRYAVLVNDFGALAIDPGLIVKHRGDTITLANGCICCSIGDSLMYTLARLLELDAPPEHVVVEASGVADPARIGDIARLDPGYQLGVTVVVVDSTNVMRQANDVYLEDTLRRQLVSADLLVLNKTDLVTKEQLAVVKKWLGDNIPKRPQIDCVRGVIPIESIIDGRPIIDSPDVQPLTGVAGEKPIRHAGKEAFWQTTFTEFASVGSQLRERFSCVPRNLLRAKGWVRMEDTSYLLQAVGARLELTEMTSSDPSCLVVIGVGEAPSIERLRELFALPSDAVAVSSRLGE